MAIFRTIYENCCSQMIEMFIFHFILLSVVVYFETGYIQPDEFFQNPEITAGDIFNISHFRAWEWSERNALRSITTPFLTTGFPFLILRTVENVFRLRASVEILIFLSRLVMILLVLALDKLIIRLSSVWPIAPSAAVSFVFRTSYLTSVFLPRTFSNSIEVFLFASLLYFVYSSEAMDFKLQRRYACIVAIISAVGIFNRPTFLALGIMPWITILFKFRIRSVISGILSGLLTILALVAIDSAYFGRFVITPLQFILYNIDIKNNAAHGLHPRYFHLIVSLPQLFGPLLFALFPSKRSTLNKDLVAAFAVPLILISIIPHQEPRFVLALCVPVFLLCSKVLWNSRIIYVSWIIFNVTLGLFFGFIHQGGVTKSLSSVRNILEFQPTAHVFFYKTYIPPTFPLLLPKSENERFTDLGLSKMDQEDVLKRLNTTVQLEKVFLLIPATLDHLTVLPHHDNQPVIMDRFCPHWSFEVQPDYYTLWTHPEQLCLNLWYLSSGYDKEETIVQ